MIESSIRQNASYIQTLTLLSALAIIYFALAVFLLHILAPDFNPINRFISEYAQSAYNYILNSGFILLGVGSILLVLVLLRLKVGHRLLGKIGLILLTVWALAVMMDGIFQIDPGVEPVTTSGKIHLLSAMVAFLSFMIASLVLSLVFRKHASLNSISRPALVLVVLIYLSFFVSNITDFAPGLIQRLFVLFCLGWLSFVALSIRRMVAG
ncbi:MAG: DUF998 domain-containing protein [Ferruginibacter sp.]|nr:DUF998 domain-containing protein [Ferruginibacter sp.]